MRSTFHFTCENNISVFDQHRARFQTLRMCNGLKILCNTLRGIIPGNTMWDDHIFSWCFDLKSVSFTLKVLNSSIRSEYEDTCYYMAFMLTRTLHIFGLKNGSRKKVLWKKKSKIFSLFVL